MFKGVHVKRKDIERNRKRDPCDEEREKQKLLTNKVTLQVLQLI